MKEKELIVFGLTNAKGMDINMRIAACVPTYNRSNIVEEFLTKSLFDYKDFGIDIYIYDSSSDDETEQVVKIWMEKSDCLFYVRIPSSFHANMKVLKIFQQEGLTKPYDFIWVCGDALRFKREALSTIMPHVLPQYDMIEVNGMDKEKLGTREYDEPNEYFKDCAWHLTLFGAVILNVKTMLSDVDWDYYESKCSSREFVNFSHVSFYFDKLVSMNNFKALHLSLNPYFVTSSPLKEKSGWYEETFHVICSGWFQTIQNLPRCYENKREAMIKFGKYTMFNTKDLLDLREKNCFNKTMFKQFRNVWKDVCDMPIIELYLIASMPILLSKYISRIRRYFENLKSMMHLKKFLKRYHQILIYGAGKKALIYGRYFEKKNISYSGFCVTDADKNGSELLGHPIYSLADIEDSLANVGIVLALNPVNMEEVVRLLQLKGVGDQVFYDNIS